MTGNGFWEQMTKEAMEELAHGDKGWREVDPNTLVLAVSCLLSENLSRKIARPLWWFAGSSAAAVVAYIVNLVITA